MNAALTNLSRKVGMLGGWRRNAAAFAFGICSTLTLAPFFIFPLIIPSYTGLYWLLQSAKTRKRMAADGWWWGWGFYMTGLYWFCVALLTEPEKFAWLIPFALFALTGLIALHSALACWLMSWVRAKGVARIYIFSVIWMSMEWLRGHWFSGFPWNLPGYSFGFSDASLQMASLVGVYGLTWFAVILGCSAAIWQEKKGKLFSGALWGVFVLGMVWGQWRLYEANQVPEEKRYVEGVLMRLVQANISQPHKWNPKFQLQGMKEYVTMTQSPGLDKVTHIIWSESAVPYALEEGSKLAKLLGESIPKGKILITGALRTEGDDDSWQIWNSLVAINHDGNIVSAYDKIRLVPFGEFQPLRDYVPKSWMTPVGDKDFSRGSNEQKLDWPGLPPMVPLICYEVLFPDMSMPAHGRPKMLLTVTNDAWFGTSTGPYQHFHMARMRAVEQGLPLVRVANTGITAVIDGMGQILHYIPLGNKEIMDVKLPVSQNGTTPYNRFNSAFIQLLIYAMLILTLKRQKTHN